MQGFDEGEDVFFDAVESLSSDSFDAFGYGIWLGELKSVKERRESFFMRMSFVEVSSSNSVAIDVSEAASERAVECGGAVTSSCSSSSVEYNSRESNGEANCLVEESPSPPEWSIWAESESSCPAGEGDENVEMKKKKMKGWLNAFVHKMKKSRRLDASSKAEKAANEAKKVTTRMEVQQKKKKVMEFSGVYSGQEISGHKGLISTMKFSPDGQYIASGGEDGIVRIWGVSLSEAAAACTTSTSASDIGRSDHTKCSSSFRKQNSWKASIVIPEKVFQINESPLHEFHGHTSDILDLAWSSSNQILSASKDNTVRLWQVGFNECLGVFLHKNYVTCIQFNPMDDNYFISGCIDGKIRIWVVPEKRVVDWADTRDVVSAVCYQPNGKGFIAGFVSGICRFYESHGTEPLLHAEMHIGGKKKSSGNRITGIQFLDNDSHRVMITSEDSKIRILDGLDIVHKYQGPTKSGRQTSASFTSSGQHIISVGEDSRVYVWNYDDLHIKSSRVKKSERSCEYFVSECVSVAIPWSGMAAMGTVKADASSCLPPAHCHKDSWYSGGGRDQDRFSLTSWFSMDISSKGSVTWPAEKLPIWDVPYSESSNSSDNLPQQLQHKKNDSQNCGNLSATWGTVIVTAGWDGKIRTFHNFGLPVKS